MCPRHPRRSRHALATLALLTALGAGAHAAHAEGTPLHALQAPQSVRIDGLVREWDSAPVELKYTVSGATPSDDCSARALVSYDRDNLYVAAEVRDDKVVANADHVELLLGIPGGTTRSVLLYPGVPGKTTADARLGPGGRIASAEIVEAPLEGGGYSLEARIPWAAFPEAKTIRIGFRGAVFVHDADKSSATETVLGTAPGRAYAGLPPLSTEPELALGQGLLREKRIWDAPSYNLMADVAGDAMSERVMLYARYLVVLGPTYRGGTEYFFRDLGSDAQKGEIGKLDVRDLTGDGKADILVLRKDDGGNHLEVLSFANGEVPDELLRDTLPARATTVSVSGGRGAARITFAGDGTSRIFELRAGKFALVDEKKSGIPSPPPVRPVTPSPSPQPPTPQPSSAADLESVYAAYRKDRSVGGAPRFDLTANLAGDGKSERLVVHGRDLVAFGPGFRDGHAYAALTLSSFARDEDVTSVKVRDVTGDGVAEVLVEGVMYSPLPAGLGDGQVARSVLVVYRLDNPSWKRIFAAELGRTLPKGSVKGSVRFLPGGELELGAGSADGYNGGTYPFTQDQGTNGGFEPLILPWSGFGPLRYRYDGKEYVR